MNNMIKTIQTYDSEIKKKIHFYEKKFKRTRMFLWIKKGVDGASWLLFANPLITVSVVGCLILLILCLSLSCALFMRFLGYPFGADWSAWDFIQYAPYAWVSEEMRGHWIFSCVAPLFVALFLVAFAVKKRSTLFGNAHWANYHEAKKAGVLGDKGLILGKKWCRYLRVGGFEHVFVFAPSGSGKTESIAMANLLTESDSMVVQDPKGTLMKRTSAYRQKHGHACFVWSLGGRDRKSHAYNPIDFVSKDKVLRIDDLQKIANIFIPDNPRTDPIWTTQPRELFVAVLLYLLDTPNKAKTIGEMVRTIKNTLNFSEWIKTIILERADLDPVCYRNFSSFLQAEYRLQTNILKSFLSYFELFENPLIDAATNHSDFDITQLKKKRMTIYVTINVSNLDRLSPLLTVFYQQIIDLSTQEIPDLAVEPYGIVMLLDEFSALRKMPVLQKSIGQIREYRLRIMAIIQDLPQVYETYGVNGAKAFINNKYRVAFANNDYDSAVLISNWLGSQTVEQKTSNTRMGSFFDVGQSTSVTKRALLLPEEIMRFNKKNMIIAIEGHAPIKAAKNFWSSDPNLKKRDLGAIAIPLLAIKEAVFDHEALKVAVKELAKRDAAKNSQHIAEDEEEID